MCVSVRAKARHGARMMAELASFVGPLTYRVVLYLRLGGKGVVREVDLLVQASLVSPFKSGCFVRFFSGSLGQQYIISTFFFLIICRFGE